MYVSDTMFIVAGIVDLQNTSPVQTKDENGKASTIQCKTNPVEVKEQVFCQLLTV